MITHLNRSLIHIRWITTPDIRYNRDASFGQQTSILLVLNFISLFLPSISFRIVSKNDIPGTR